MLAKAARAIGKVLGASAVIAAVALAALFLVIPRLTGGAALSVLTGSMTPTIPVGSLVLVVPTDPQTIGPGDVITFQTAPGVAEYVTHRVVRVQPDTQPMTFITKGDANKGEDADPVPVGAVRGTVRFHVPYAGAAANSIRTPAGLLLVGIIPAAMVIFALARNVVGEMRKARAEADAVPASPQEPVATP